MGVKNIGHFTERLMVLGLGIFLVALAAESAMLFHFVGDTANTRNRVSHTHQVLAQLATLLVDMVDIETGTRGYLIVGRPEYLEPYDQSRQKLDRDVRTLMDLTADDPHQQEHIRALLPQIAQEINTSQYFITLRQDEGFNVAQAKMAQSQGLEMAEIRRRIGDLMAEEQRLLVEREARDRSAAHDLKQMVSVLGILTGITLLGISGAVFYGLRLKSEMMRKLDAIAHTDALTGLFNRRHLMIQATALLALSARRNSCAAVLFLDLDGFKAVNDTYGHDIGDELLRIVAHRLKSNIRSSDLLARLGGDEFVVFLPEIDSVTAAEHVAGKVVAALGQPYPIDNIEAHVTASIGIALSPADGTDVETLLQHADLALYEAKNAGKSNYVLYRNDGFSAN
jgi:diguanylate cyclase (GGDEF)-like protein